MGVVGWVPLARAWGAGRPPLYRGEGKIMRAETCIRYLDVLGMGIGSGKRAWTDEERRAYYGLLRHFRSMKKREMIDGEPLHDHPFGE